MNISSELIQNWFVSVSGQLLARKNRAKLGTGMGREPFGIEHWLDVAENRASSGSSGLSSSFRMKIACEFWADFVVKSM